MKFKIRPVLFLTLGLTLALSGCSSMPTKKEILLFKMENPPVIGETLSQQKVYLGGLSGLDFIEQKGDVLLFQTLTDRGPNGELVNGERTFLLPDYSPSIVKLKAHLSSKELVVDSIIPLKNKKNEPMTGLPHNRQDENPIDVFGIHYSVDTSGLDSEAIVSDGEGGFWIAEEYGPSLLHFNNNGQLIKRLSPVSELPRMYSLKKVNRGFEAIARKGNKLWAILQSPLPANVVDDKKQSRVIEIDVETSKITAEYFYPFDGDNDKIGDAVAIDDNHLLVLEQNGKLGDKSSKLIYKVKLGASDETLTKKLVVDLKGTEFSQYEKIEGLALVDSTTIALVLDNDFEISGLTDKKTGITPTSPLKNQLLK